MIVSTSSAGDTADYLSHTVIILLPRNEHVVFIYCYYAFYSVTDPQSKTYPPTTYPQQPRRYLQYLTFVSFYMFLYFSLHPALFWKYLTFLPYCSVV